MRLPAHSPQFARLSDRTQFNSVYTLMAFCRWLNQRKRSDMWVARVEASGKKWLIPQ